MIYTEDIFAYQGALFVKALALGALLGFCYDCLRVLRVLIKFGKKLFIVSDFIYCLWAAFLIFSFLLNENYGLSRLYIYIAITLGFCAWYFTLGRLNLWAAKLLRKIILFVLRPFKAVFCFLHRKLKPLSGKIKIIFIKSLNLLKKALKNIYGIVYNIMCINILKAFPVCGGKTGKERKSLESSGSEKTEQRDSPQNSSCCLRSIRSVFNDIDPSEYKQ